MTTDGLEQAIRDDWRKPLAQTAWRDTDLEEFDAAFARNTLAKVLELDSLLAFLFMDGSACAAKYRVTRDGDWYEYALWTGATEGQDS